jgi:hypothetical protein
LAFPTLTRARKQKGSAIKCRPIFTVKKLSEIALIRIPANIIDGLIIRMLGKWRALCGPV